MSSKWAQPSDEERMRAFLAKQQNVDVQPAYYRTGDVSTGEGARMETGNQYKSNSGKIGGVAPSGGVPQTRTCFECRTQQAKDAKFCAGCGASLAPPPSAGIRCPGCGHSNPSGKFCSECGHSLAAPVAAPPPTCACGVLKTNAKFCANCGSKWH